jgi:hypothetical protein
MSRSSINKKTYLGDGVYSDFDGYIITLTTENGFLHSTNTIILEPDVALNLINYLNHISLYRCLRCLKKETNDPSIISPSELDRCLHSDSNDTGWTK